MQDSQLSCSINYKFTKVEQNLSKITQILTNWHTEYTTWEGVQHETEENWGLKHTWGKHEAKYTGWNTAGNTGEPKLTKETGEAKLKISAQDRGVTK